MTQEALELRRAAGRAYYRKNADRINEQHKAWRKAHPEKVKEYRAAVWEHKVKALADQQDQTEPADEERAAFRSTM